MAGSGVEREITLSGYFNGGKNSQLAVAAAAVRRRPVGQHLADASHDHLPSRITSEIELVVFVVDVAELCLDQETLHSLIITHRLARLHLCCVQRFEWYSYESNAHQPERAS